MKRHKEEASRQEKQHLPFTAFRSALQRTDNALGVPNVAHIEPLHKNVYHMETSRKEGRERKERKRKMEKRRGGDAPTHLFTHVFILREPNGMI